MTSSRAQGAPEFTLLAITAIAALAASAVIGCDPGGDRAPKVPLAQARESSPQASPLTVEGAPAALSVDAKAALDSGNALFRKKAYAEALAMYRRSANRAPEHPAPPFGIYMVARALNNVALADSALADIKARGGTPDASPHAVIDPSARPHRVGTKRGDGS